MTRVWPSNWVSTRRSMEIGVSSSARLTRLKKSPRRIFAASPTKPFAKKTGPSAPWKRKHRNPSNLNPPKVSRNDQGKSFALHNCSLDDEFAGDQFSRPDKETHPRKSSAGHSHAFCCSRHFMAKSSYSTAASVQTAGAAPCRAAQRH